MKWLNLINKPWFSKIRSWHYMTLRGRHSCCSRWDHLDHSNRITRWIMMIPKTERIKKKNATNWGFEHCSISFRWHNSLPTCISRRVELAFFDVVSKVHKFLSRNQLQRLVWTPIIAARSCLFPVPNGFHQCRHHGFIAPPRHQNPSKEVVCLITVGFLAFGYGSKLGTPKIMDS